MCIERLYLNIRKARYDKSTANIIPNKKKLKALPLTFKTREGYPLLWFLFNIVLVSRGIRQEKERKGIQRGKVPICRCYDSIYRKIHDCAYL
jgi:hypothetical protein